MADNRIKPENSHREPIVENETRMPELYSQLLLLLLIRVDTVLICATYFHNFINSTFYPFCLGKNAKTKPYIPHLKEWVLRPRGQDYKERKNFRLCIFYLLLISFSEHIGFLPAYTLSASACIILITWYTRHFLNRKSASLITGTVLTCFFTLFYIILQHEGYSLVIGASSLFFILAFMMWLTRKLDWYTVFKSAPRVKFRSFKSKQSAAISVPAKGETK